MLDKYLKSDLKIKQVSQIKYLLRITFNDKLTWKPHIQQICFKLFSGSWATLKLRQYVDLLIRVSTFPNNGSGSGLAPAQNILAVQVWFGFT